MEKPILFNTEEVKAILDGRKTMTRRAIKPQTVTHNGPDGQVTTSLDDFMYRNKKDFELLCAASAPYQPGDILWVRETWLKADDGYYYKADIKVPSESENLRKTYGYKWRPSIHMPREAARLFLRVKGVGVERLQDITEEDAEKKGVKAYGPNNCSGTSARIAFAELWDSTIKKQDIDRYGWAANPWVWVIEFEKVDK